MEISCISIARLCQGLLVFSLLLEMESLASLNLIRASLVAQWLRIHLPLQGTRVQALAWEDPTCRGATKPVRHNY